MGTIDFGLENGPPDLFEGPVVGGFVEGAALDGFRVSGLISLRDFR